MCNYVVITLCNYGEIEMAKKRKKKNNSNEVFILDGYQPKKTDKPEGQNPPSGFSNVKKRERNIIQDTSAPPMMIEDMSAPPLTIEGQLKKQRENNIPISFRVDPQEIDILKSIAREISFKENKDITYVDIIRGLIHKECSKNDKKKGKK